MTVSATSDSHVFVKSFGGTGGLVGVSLLDATGTVSRNTRASVSDGSTIRARDLEVTATATRMFADVDSEIGSVGVAGSGVAVHSTATVSGDVEAWVGQLDAATTPAQRTVIDLTGLATIRARSDSARAVADARGGSGSVLIAVTIMDAKATVSGAAAYLGRLEGPATLEGLFLGVGLTISASAVATHAEVNASVRRSAWPVGAAMTAPTTRRPPRSRVSCGRSPAPWMPRAHLRSSSSSSDQAA